MRRHLAFFLGVVLALLGGFVGAAPATAGGTGGYGVNNPKVEVDLKCGSIDITLTNKDIEAGYDQPVAAVFLVRVDSGEWERIEVEPEGEETWTKDFAEDSGDHQVAVKIEGGETKTFTVKTDCETPIPAKPDVQVEAQCLPGGGASGQVTLRNLAEPRDGQTPLSVTFIVKVEGQDDREVTVEAGQQPERIPFSFEEGDGTRKVTVSVGSRTLVERDVRVDCVEPHLPPIITITSECLPYGGAEGQVVLEVPTGGTPVTFTVAIEGEDDQVVTVQPGGTETIPFSFPEGTGTRTVTVSIDGAVKATEEVDVDCVEAPPHFEITSECLPAGGAQGEVVLGVDADGNPVTFTVAIEGEDDQVVTVQPGGTETIPFSFPEGTGTRTVTISIGGEIVDTEHVDVDCVDTPPPPAATITAECLPAGGATGLVTLTNPAGAAGPVTFTVAIQDQPTQQVPVEAGQTGTVEFTFPEGEGTRNVTVSTGGTVIATEDVDVDCANTDIDKTADPAEGTPVQAPEHIVYSVKISNSSALQSATGDVVDTLPVGVKVVAGTISDGGTLSADEKTITWKDVSLEAGGSKTFTFEVEVTAGFGTPQLLNKSTWLGNSDQTIHPVLAISGDAVALCIEDAPYYTLTVNSQNHELFSSQDVTVDWYRANAQGQPIDAQGNPTTDPTQFVRAINPLTNEPIIQNYTLDANGQLNVTALWPGAAVDADGNATQWPGWILNSDGTWTQVDDGGVREHAVIVVTVNPTLSGIATYPPSASGCANPTNTPPDNPPDNPPNNPELPKTGGNLAPQLALALMMLVSGGALKGGSLLARRR